MLKFTVVVETINWDDFAFGKFQIWLNPCYAMVNSGHGYRDRVTFWPIAPSKYGKTSEPTLRSGLHTGKHRKMGFRQSALIVSNGEIVNERKIFWTLCCN